MAQDPAGSPPREEGVDIFEHEVEELERSIWKDSKVHPLIVVAGAAMVALALGAAFVLMSSTGKTGELGASRIMNIEVREPRSGQLSERPTTFSWESIAGVKSYVLSLQERGGTRDLIVRETTSTSIELSSSEASALVMGGSYIWRIRARSAEGWTIGEGGGTFTL